MHIADWIAVAVACVVAYVFIRACQGEKSTGTRRAGKVLTWTGKRERVR